MIGGQYQVRPEVVQQIDALLKTPGVSVDLTREEIPAGVFQNTETYVLGRLTVSITEPVPAPTNMAGPAACLAGVRPLERICQEMAAVAATHAPGGLRELIREWQRTIVRELEE